MMAFTKEVATATKADGEEAGFKFITEKVYSMEDSAAKEKREKRSKFEAAEKERLAKEAAAEELAMAAAVFTDEENLKLTQALKKFPGGTINRWEKISQYVGTRTPKEVMAGTKELQKAFRSGKSTGSGMQAAAGAVFNKLETELKPTEELAKEEAKAAPKKELSAAAKLGAAAALEDPGEGASSIHPSHPACPFVRCSFVRDDLLPLFSQPI